MMKVLFIGDVFGPPGMAAISRYVPILREKLDLDFVVANGENAAADGMNPAIVEQFLAAGVDGITSGNHMWDDPGIYDIIDHLRVVRPANYKDEKPGRGLTLLENARGHKLLIVNLLGRLFMSDDVHNPFKYLDPILADFALGQDVNGILVDFHTETTAEKNAMGTWCDGRVSMVVGTHTHMPTADHHILPGGTAYQTDVGMTGDYDSNIGVRKDIFMRRFAEDGNDKEFPSACADGEPTLCGCVVEIDPATGVARSIEPVRVGGVLTATHELV